MYKNVWASERLKKKGQNDSTTKKHKYWAALSMVKGAMGRYKLAKEIG